ncbi:DUF2953 domain-containing protein [Bacillus sp. FJAT-52991]|uniref:DUF2953 domain-containing protein n=1 Tax=Bacillus kandeliae TaxID=3129297 RepID=A0ABZ2N3Y8_9BACI
MVYAWWLLGGLFFMIVVVCLSKLRVIIHSFFEKDNIDIKVRLELWNGLLSYTVKVPFMKLLTYRGKKPPSLFFEKETKTKDGQKTKNADKKEITYAEFEEFLSDARELTRRVESLREVLRSFLKKVEIKNVCWKTVLGMKDAAWTGMAAGSLWTVKSGAISIASYLMRMTSEPKMMITPVFGQSVLRTEFSCMIAFRPGQAIVAVIKILSRWRSKKRKWGTAAINKQV